MKVKTATVLFLLTCTFSTLQAQLEAIKLTATKGNETGLTYILPNTAIQIDILSTKTTRKAGQFYQYAEKYLGVKDVVTKDDVVWTLDKINAWGRGQADKSNAYLLPLRPNDNPFIYLTPDGLLASINVEPDLSLLATSNLQPEAKEKVKNIDPLSVMTEEFMLASSTAKMAEVAAKQIYRIRESRMNIMMGEVDNMPKDGEALKIIMNQLDEQEKVLTEMFTGKLEKEQTIQSYTFMPQGSTSNYVVCRFSKHLGLVDKDDLSGVPVFFSIKDITDESLFEISGKDKVKKGVIYQIPGDAAINITFSGKTVFEAEMKVAQFGTTAFLPTSGFENKKNPQKALFYPDLGSVKEIFQ